jgi:hypothetical protein
MRYHLTTLTLRRSLARYRTRQFFASDFKLLVSQPVNFVPPGTRHPGPRPRQCGGAIVYQGEFVGRNIRIKFQMSPSPNCHFESLNLVTNSTFFFQVKTCLLGIWVIFLLCVVGSGLGILVSMSCQFPSNGGRGACFLGLILTVNLLLVAL